MNHRALLNLIVVVVLTVAGSAGCRLQPWRPVQRAPVVFQTDPTLADIMAAVNANRSLVTSLYSTRATISSKGFPGLRATLAVESPRRMRLQAGTGISGSELDLGSNDQLFWIWIKRNQPPAMYFGYHDRFSSSRLRQMIPVRPEWIIEALGLVYLDPNHQHEGPWTRPDGRLEVRSRVPSPEGIITKSLVLDRRSGWIYEQHLYDTGGQQVASAYSSQHLRDEPSGVTLPRKTIIKWYATDMTLQLELQDVQINPLQLSPDLWTKPDFPGYANIDVTQSSPSNPALPSGSGLQPPAAHWQGLPPQPRLRPADSLPIPTAAYPAYPAHSSTQLHRY